MSKWPPRSSDLTPLDLFLKRFVKIFVYSFYVHDLDTLKTRIRNGLVLVIQEMLSKTWDEIKNCMETLQDIRGAHGEEYCVFIQPLVTELNSHFEKI